MVTTLVKFGEGRGFVIDPALLERYRIGDGTPVEITDGGDGLVIRPVGNDHARRVEESARRMLEIHSETFGKLAR